MYTVQIQYRLYLHCECIQLQIDAFFYYVMNPPSSLPFYFYSNFGAVPVDEQDFFWFLITV